MDKPLEKDIPNALVAAALVSAHKDAVEGKLDVEGVIALHGQILAKMEEGN